jgi:hypothetical protein
LRICYIYRISIRLPARPTSTSPHCALVLLEHVRPMAPMFRHLLQHFEEVDRAEEIAPRVFGDQLDLLLSISGSGSGSGRSGGAEARRGSGLDWSEHRVLLGVRTGLGAMEVAVSEEAAARPISEKQTLFEEPDAMLTSSPPTRSSTVLGHRRPTAQTS